MIRTVKWIEVGDRFTFNRGNVWGEVYKDGRSWKYRIGQGEKKWKSQGFAYHAKTAQGRAETALEILQNRGEIV